MKNVQTLVKFTDKEKEKLKHAYIDALQNPKFKELVQLLKIDEQLLMKYTSRLEESAIEFDNCKTCKGLIECRNKITGYICTPVKNNKIINFSYQACPYTLKKLKDTSYQKYISLFDISKEIKEASMKNIYTDDKNRLSIIKYFKEFIDSYFTNDTKKGIYLSGSFGSGKTYLVAALFNELAKREVNSAIIYFPEFLRNLKASFNDDFNEKFIYIKKVPLLLIDDIGAENLTAWGRDEILGPILQYRMESHLPTFFTSNLNIEELKTHLSITNGSVDLIKAKRIIERIKQLTIDMSLVSENRRS